MDEYDVLGGYFPSFVQHLNDTKARFGVGIASQVSDGADIGDSIDAQALSSWTSAEHDAFFRAIAVHSRWRSDLIAACVPTKTEWEVWMYLEALEEGDAMMAMQGADAEGSGDEDMQSSADEDEAVCEPALEVSQAWIDVEERMAAWIVQQEHLASIESGSSDMTDVHGEPPPKRKRGRSRSTRRGSQPQDEPLEYSKPPRSRERSSTSRRKRARKLSIPPAERREALMGHLEDPHLLVLDTILREGEDAMQEKSQSQEASVTGAALTEGTSNDPSNPVLLALSTGTDPAEVPSAGAAPTRGSSSLLSSLQPANNMTQTTKSDLTVFSPGSRRRIQKRLYMRRKRAKVGEGVLNTAVEKLKPGKKARSETPARSTSVGPSEGPSNTESEETEDVCRKNKGGLTLPYKLKAQFSELGIDAVYLGREGMNLINLGALGKMMGLYTCLEEVEDGLQSIDAQLIRHLQAAMISFVTDIVHRAIVWREREIRLKQRSQVWRHGEHITIAAIEHAVRAVGARYHSHKVYFETLSSTAANDTEDDPVTDRASRLSPHRDVYMPLYRSPSGGVLSCLTRTYEGRSRRAEIEDDDDEEGEEEEESTDDVDVDERDMEMGREEETRLWKIITLNK